MPKHLTAAPRLSIAIVLDAADAQAMRDLLAQVADPRRGRVLVAPTPGAADRTTLALDVMAALGKNPAVLRREGTRAWALATAWLAAHRPTDLIIDRAHLLTPGRLADAADLSQAAGATLWLIWSGPKDHSAVLATLTDPARTIMVVDPGQMRAMLPTAPRPRIPARQPGPTPARLPSADFPLFLATCRRHLKPQDFDALAEAYHRAAERTDAWLDTHTRRIPMHESQFTQRVAGPLSCWLRDRQLGPSDTAHEALITLRATQAALFVHGILLCWNRDALGEHPETRLPRALSPERYLALSSTARTDHAAATALSLHLSQPPGDFGCWSLRDIAADGRFLRPASTHRHSTRPGTSRLARSQPPPGYPAEMEPACTQPILLPDDAALFIAAHLAYRRSQGAAAGDRYFVHPEDEQLSVAGFLHSGIQHACDHINFDPAWMHRVECPQRATGAGTGRTHGWLAARGLRIHGCAPMLAAALPLPTTAPR